MPLQELTSIAYKTYQIAKNYSCMCIVHNSIYIQIIEVEHYFAQNFWLYCPNTGKYNKFANIVHEEFIIVSNAQ